MEVAFVGGAMQVVCTVINNVLTKSRKVDNTVELELQQQLLLMKQKVVALEMELAELHHKMQRDEREARQRRLKMTVETLQLQIRKEKLDRRDMSAWSFILRAFDHVTYLWIGFVVSFWYAVGLSIQVYGSHFVAILGE